KPLVRKGSQVRILPPPPFPGAVPTLDILAKPLRDARLPGGRMAPTRRTLLKRAGVAAVAGKLLESDNARAQQAPQTAARNSAGSDGFPPGADLLQPPHRAGREARRTHPR